MPAETNTAAAADPGAKTGPIIVGTNITRRFGGLTAVDVDRIETHTIACLVDNESGVLARVEGTARVRGTRAGRVVRGAPPRRAHTLRRYTSYSRSVTRRIILARSWRFWAP